MNDHKEQSAENDAPAKIKVGDSVVARNGKRGLRWRVTRVENGFVTAERVRKGHVPVIAIYRTETWRKR